MSMSGLSFIGIYFPILFIVYYNPFIRKRQFRNVILLLASLGMYAMAEPVYIVLLLGSIVLNYFFTWIAVKVDRKVLGTIIIVLDVAVLFFFKYINQILSAFLVNKSNLASIAFPIGISYFTFQEISFVVDSMKAKRMRSNLFETALYISCFWRIVAGPIGQYDDCVDEIRNREESADKIGYGLFRFALGLTKKIMIADSIQPLVTICFNGNDNSVAMAWAGAIAYTLELYVDFSGYSDMAIGMGSVFGFEVEENFNYPYTASSVSEFWRKWHISLTKWFTRYIYIPLGGSRVRSVSRHIFNLWVVWLCTGIWHGSSFTFIIWGMIYFIVQALEKYTGFNDEIARIHLEHVYTMLVVTLQWVIFNSKSVGAACMYIGNMFGIGASKLASLTDIKTIGGYAVSLIIAVIFSTPVGKFAYSEGNSKKVNALMQVVVVITFAISVVMMLGKGYSAPLYAGF